MSFAIRALGAADAAAFRGVRLRALRDTPEAFGSTEAEEASLSTDLAAERYGLVAPTAGDAGAIERVVLGAFDGAGTLVGVVGCARERLAKARHRATVWGMYVAAEQRGRGLGRALVEALIAEVRRWPGLEQLTLQVVPGCRAARGLYERCGFRACGRHPDAYRQDGRSFDVEHMLLVLPPPTG